MPHTHFDESNEEYLEAIYRLEREGPGVTNSALASELGVAPASVSGMLKKLATEGFIEHQARGGVALTRKGLETAVRVVRRNRLAEVFLTQILGLPVAQLEVGGRAKLHSVTEQMTELLRYLSEIGLKRGTTIEVVEKAPLGGPITIAYDGRRQAISLDLAKQLTVTDF